MGFNILKLIVKDMNWETLLSFGDSISFGARSYLGYPEICGEFLSNTMEKEWHVINHSTNGFTTADLLRSLNPVMWDYKNSYPSIITVMIGTNDVKNNTSLTDFMMAYKQLIIKLRLMAVNNNIVLLKLPSLSKNVFYPYNFAMNERINECNAVIDNLAKDNKLRVLEFSFKEDDFFDGVHLNAKGSETAAMQLSAFILKDKGFESTPDLP